MTPVPAIETRGLTRRFGGFVAVQDVDLSVATGSIHALIGPNGAGKTTLFNMIARSLDVSAGSICLMGEDITHLPAAEAARRGIVRSFQISAIFPRMSVAENVRIALQRPAGMSWRLWRSARSLRVLDGRVGELLDRVGLGADKATTAANLSYGRRRILELATTLALDPKVMLLDEPMAGLGREDVARVTDLIRESAVGRTVLMVEHNLDVVASLAQRITVLARGQVLAEGDYAAISADPAVIEAYIGGEDD